MAAQAPSARVPFWDDRPPAVEPSFIQIVWPEPKLSVTGIVTQHTLVGVWTHYSGSRTLPCIGRANGCEFCGPYASRRWQGYLGIYCPREGRLYLAQISKEAAARNPLLANPGNSLRGFALTLKRLGDARNSRVRAELVAGQEHADLPEPFDVRKALCRLWGFCPQIVGFEVEPSVRKEP